MSDRLELSRVLPLEGAVNFRDLGGYRGEGGRRVRWRTLFRADGLHRLTAGDLEHLEVVGLRTVIDLRTEAEVTGRGRIEWPAAELAYHHLPMIDVLPPAEDMEHWARPDYVGAQYVAMLEEGEATVKTALGVLGDPGSYPAVYHCAAGKDRTGILSAVVLGLLGVAEDDIVADYALSQEAMERLLERLRVDFPDRVGEIDRSAAAMGAADPLSMRTFLDRFLEVEGSFATFAERLGLAEAVEGLRSALLEPPGPLDA